jgi:tRNA pseudouridine13 synthase
MSNFNLPYLTANQPGIGGQLKATPKDFVVEEIPLYAASGAGQHVYALIEKTGLSTYAAVKAIARALNISPDKIGYAGLKDAQAVTRQTISIDNVSPAVVEALDLPHIKIINVNRHQNKLRTGHLAGNRFTIKVRQVTPTALPIAQAILETLTRRGVPNYFGEQRFGNRGNTGRLGELLIRGEAAEFVAEYLGRPQPGESPKVRAARQLIDEGKWVEALACWPPFLADERRVLAALQKTGEQPEAAFEVLNKKIKGFFVSAFQAELFNALLVERLASLGRLEAGDVAYIHSKGACFVVDNAAVEQPRADVFEISPAGPLFGPKTLAAQGAPGQREAALLAKYNLTCFDFSAPGLKIQGARRPYRFQLKAVNCWWDDGLMISFELPPGAYATTVMAEVMKPAG